MRLNDFLTIPNLLSISRIILAPVAGYFLWLDTPVATMVALGVVIVAGISDGLDGYLARRLGQVNRLGVVLDPVADKLFAAILVIFLIMFREFPVWLMIVIIGRDLLILLAGSLIIKKRELVVSSNLTGKYAFTAMAVMLASYIIRFEPTFPLMTWVTVILLGLSLIAYVRVLSVTLKSGSPPEFVDRPVFKLTRGVLALVICALFLYKLILFIVQTYGL